MMKNNFFEICTRGFTLGCTIAALILCIKCIHQYSLNKDNSSVIFKNYHADESSLYPSISLCFGNLWEEDFNCKDADAYSKFLSGCQSEENDCKWDKSLSDLDYDNVTQNLLKFVVAEMTYFHCFFRKIDGVLTT